MRPRKIRRTATPRTSARAPSANRQERSPGTAMLHFQTWKIVVIVVVCAFGVIFSLPNLFSAETLDKLPGFVPKQQVNLGLDLRGGSHLLLEVDFGAALK